jgi:hypothetical protein
MENDLLFTNKFVKTYDASSKIYKAYPSNRFRNYIDKKNAAKNQKILTNVNVKENKQIKTIPEIKHYTLENEILLNIDSSNRDITIYPDSNTYKIKIDPPIKNVKKIEMISSEFPNTEQLIRGNSSNSQNNIVQFRLLNDFIYGVGDKTYGIEIFPGNYNSITLSEEMTIKMNDLKKKYDNKNFEFEVSLDDVSDNSSINLINSDFSKYVEVLGTTFFEENGINTNAFSNVFNFKFTSYGDYYSDHNIEKGDKIYILGSNPVGYAPTSLINGQHFVHTVPNQSIFKFKIPYFNKYELTGKGGELLKIAKDEYFQLLFNNNNSPYDILGFKKENTNFKESHDNLVIDGSIINIITGVFLDEETYDNNMYEFETYEPHNFSIGNQIYINNHLKIYDNFNEVNYIVGNDGISYANDYQVNSYNSPIGVSGISSGIFDGETIGQNEFIITNVTNSKLYSLQYKDNDDTATSESSSYYLSTTQIRNGLFGSAEQINIDYTLMQIRQDTNQQSNYYTSTEHNVSVGDKIIITTQSSVSSIDINNITYEEPVIINTTTIKLSNTTFNNNYIIKSYQITPFSTLSSTTNIFDITLDRVHGLRENDLLFVKLHNDDENHLMNLKYTKITSSDYNSSSLQMLVMSPGVTDLELTQYGYLFVNGSTQYNIICSTLYKPDKTLQSTGGDTFYLRFFTEDDHDLVIDGSSKIYIKNHHISRLTNGLNQANGHSIVEVPSSNKFRVLYPESFNDDFQSIVSVTYTHSGTVAKKKVNNLIDFSGDDYILLSSPQLSSFEKNSIQTYDDIFAKILLTGEPGTFLFNTHKSTPKVFYDNELPTINELEFTFKRPDGTLFEFLGKDHSFTLKVTQLINKIGGNDFSSRTGNYNTLHSSNNLSSSHNNLYMQ